MRIPRRRGPQFVPIELNLYGLVKTYENSYSYPPENGEDTSQIHWKNAGLMGFNGI